jgi:hypothetical protein
LVGDQPGESLGSAFRIYAYPIVNPSFETELRFTQLVRNVMNENARKMKSPEACLIERKVFVVSIPGIDCHSYRMRLNVYRRWSMAPICNDTLVSATLDNLSDSFLRPSAPPNG